MTVAVADTRTAGRERPLVFSAPMVRAILAGQKFQTRRLVAEGRLKVRLPEPVRSDPHVLGPADELVAAPGIHRAGMNKHGAVWVLLDGDRKLGVKPNEFVWRCPYGAPGERLWVRETFIVGYEAEGRGHWSAIPPTGSTERDGRVFYRATFDEPDPDEAGTLPWRSPRFMPRWASRINLEIAGIRMERLNAITDADAAAEGIQHANGGSYRDAFAHLWNTIHTGPANCWQANPWVWVLSFRRIRP